MNRWTLAFSCGELASTVEIGPGSHLLGSAPSTDIRVAHPTVSRRHARITCAADGVTVEDLGSTNGTFVGEQRIDAPTRLPEAGRFRAGSVEIRLVRSASPPGAVDQRLGESSSGASMLLGPATVGFLRDAGEEVAFLAGEVVVRRGEHQDFFYVVIEGEVELLLNEGEARRRPLARLGEGGIFGAESVLGKEGAAIDAVAATDVRLLRYPASALPTALQESASLRRKLLGGFARNLHKTTADALDLLHGAEVIARLVQGDSDPDRLIAVSPRMKAIARRLDELAEQAAPVLVVGEDGTGKTQIARLIHDASTRAGGPLIAVNCQDLSPARAAELILGEDLGGRLQVRGHASGGIHLAHAGTLVLRRADALEPAVQQMLAAFLRTHARRPPGTFPDTRIILTARARDAVADARSGLIPALAECFGEVLDVPPLASRPKDILPLAEEFLARHCPSPPTITEAAQHALLSLRYQRRNVAELRETVELAVRLADGPEIRPEHIFGGVGEDAAPPGMDITGTPLLQRLLRRPALPLLRGLSLAGFAAVIVLCLAAAGSTAGRIANAAIWSLWEPAVFALFFVIGPVWCTVCPLSTAARLAKRLGASERPPPPFLIRHGPWLAIVGFALIVWVERVFDSPSNPLASGLLLASLLAAAVLGSLLFRREVWCRHLCPLGRLATALAPAAPIQLTAKPRVCASTCSTHACYKGSPGISGCTVFHHPLEGKQAYRCKLCLDCLQSCPHHSANLQVRAPLIALWRLDGAAADLSMFASAVALLGLVLVASRSFGTLGDPLAFTLSCALAVAAGIALHLVVAAVAGSDRRRAQMVQLAMTLMILAWSALMTSQLANILVLNQARITLPDLPWLPQWLPTQLSLLLLLQVGLVLAALALALFALGQISFQGSSLTTRLGRRLAPLVLVGYAGLVVVLLSS
ncbi:MAG: sigma 54-interacting transcriptional regulator [Thermoanaerobaculales bacterium]|jgi:transcriptional regulator with AAA-type ATPase domain/polyferredoxin|nr:sigma 54-interacting transcriptional regulator [Thermoanaerobaculales bacterium]